MCCASIPESQIQSGLVHRQPFETQAILDKCSEWPQNNLKHYKVKGKGIYFTGVDETQILVRSAIRPFWSYRPFWHKCWER